MKRLQLPKNKLARLAINVVLVWLWLPIVSVFIADLLRKVIPITIPPICFSIVYLSFVFIPIVLVTRYIWFGRIRPKRRITTSMDD